MKTILLMIALTLITGCCDDQPRPSPYEQVFKGNHLLRQVASYQSLNGSFDAGYFLFAGAGSGTMSTDYNVTFSWEGNDGIYRYQTLPLEKVQMFVNQGIGTPYVKFRWNTYGDVLYVVIGVNPKDWPQKIEMPLTH